MVTWGPKAAGMTQEERDRYMQGVMWEIDQGHSSEVKCMDGIRWRSFNMRTMRWEIDIRWMSIPAWVGDRFRSLAADLRKFRTRYILRRKNPYWAD